MCCAIEKCHEAKRKGKQDRLAIPTSSPTDFFLRSPSIPLSLTPALKQCANPILRVQYAIPPSSTHQVLVTHSALSVSWQDHHRKRSNLQACPPCQQQRGKAEDW